MRAGYHNHQYEWVELADSDGGRHAMDILAAGTPEAVTLQLDVGTCVEMKRDPAAWIRSHPGRIRSMHCKDWAPGTEEDEKGYRVLLGEGAAPWKEIFTAAEGVGGVEYYLIEQEGSRYSSLETAKRSMAIWKKLHG
jgi:sugar phosphate isomerase/epimerase